MSDERLDAADMSDVSDTASWADAQADTPTMGKNFSDSEDTLSNLSFDNELVVDGGFESVPSNPNSPPQLTSPKESGAGTAGGSATASAVNKSVPEIQISIPHLNASPRAAPRPAPRGLQLSQYKSDEDVSQNTSSSSGIRVQFCVTTAEYCGDGSGGQEFQLNLPPGVSYQAPTVDFPASPSQIKFSQGESFLPKEDAGTVSEDDVSFTSACRAHLDLNLPNGSPGRSGSRGSGGVGLHLTRKEALPPSSFSTSTPYVSANGSAMSVPSFQITGAEDSLTNYGNNNNKGPTGSSFLSPTNYKNEPESLMSTTIESGTDQEQELDDYMEDFYLPISNESVMSRQTSFRRKVQKELDTAAAQTAIRELNKFEHMLTSYDEEAEHELSYEGDEEEGEGDRDHRISSSTPKNRRRSSTPLVNVSVSPSTPGASNENGYDLNLYDPERSVRLEENSHRITFGRGKDQVKDVRRLNKVKQVLNFDEVDDVPPSGHANNGVSVEPESMLDIDTLCFTHAPNLMSAKRHSDSSDVSEFEHFQLKNSSYDEPQSLLLTTANLDDLESGFYLQKTTIDKLASVYDLTNFTNLYTLSGELKHILTSIEIEEIVQNRVHLENIIDPKVMAALSWSLTENNVPVQSQPAQNANAKVVLQSDDDRAKTPVVSAESPPPLIIVDDSDSTAKQTTVGSSKNSSISAGFHSQSPSVESLTSNECGSESSDEVIFETTNHHINKNKNASDNNREESSNFVRGVPENSSLRRKIKINDDSITSDLPTKYVDEPLPNPAVKKLNGTNSSFCSAVGHNRSYSNESNGGGDSRNVSTNPNSTVWRSLESLDDLNVEDDIDLESGNESENTSTSGNANANGGSNLVLVRRDSKRFKNSKREVLGLFVESKNGVKNGTLKRIKAPLHLSEDYTPGTGADPTDSSLEFNSANANADTASNTSKLETDEQGSKNNASKKRISVDEKILSMASELDDSSQATNADLTQSDVFHSIMSSLKDDDPTIRSDDDDDEVDDITLDLDSSPDGMEDSILGNIENIEIIQNPNRNGDPGHRLDDQSQEMWKSFRIGANDVQIDMKAIEPYRRVLSHGGYFDVEKTVSIILFSGCYLPDRSRREYSHLMDHLFLYVLSGLEELIAQDYILVYLHGATPRSCQPTFGWLKRCYQLIDRKLKKNLKSLYLVHPTFWLRTVVALTKPFISSKFSQKIQFVNTLSELCLEIPTEHLTIPEKVLQYDFDQRIAQLKKEDQLA